MDILAALLPMALLVAAVAGLISFALDWLLRRFVPGIHRALVLVVISGIWPIMFYVFAQSIISDYNQSAPRHRGNAVNNSAEAFEAENRAMGEGIALVGCIFFGVTSLFGGITGAVIATAKPK